MNKIIIIEGPDGSGKSFLSKQIMQRYPNHVYIHNAVTPNIKELHVNTFDAALIAAQHHTVIIDRLHISERVYGSLFRNGESYDVDDFDKWVDQLSEQHGNCVVKIMCMVDKKTSCGIHDSRKDEEMFDDNSPVWDKYNEEISKLSSSWKVYDWEKNDLDLESFEVSEKVKA